uniref:Uncharacterized protein n=1 Tax=Rhizophora mucronata TaxID=61149 RepID=A0A2P2N624_RHIMU
MYKHLLLEVIVTVLFLYTSVGIVASFIC